MTNKLKLKSCHEVIETVNVADVDSIFQGKPTDTDILTVVMKDGTRLYCDEVCPVDSLHEEPVNDNLEKEMDNYLPTVFSKDMDGGEPRFTTWFKALRKTAIYFAKWQKEQLMVKAKEYAIDGYLYAVALDDIFPELKDRYTWKPTEEHIHWLKWAINRMPDTEKANEAEAVLKDLLEQLKKLREE